MPSIDHAIAAEPGAEAAMFEQCARAAAQKITAASLAPAAADGCFVLSAFAVLTIKEAERAAAEADEEARAAAWAVCMRRMIALACTMSDAAAGLSCVQHAGAALPFAVN